jgi:phosphonopyruvate decarboxylase
MKETNNFYMAGNMGGALSLGLGAALAGKKVFVLGGDAEFVMHMGGLTTAGRYKDRNLDLTYIMFDNEQNKSTGGQATFQKHIDYISIAKASGLNVKEETILTLDEFKNTLLDNNKFKFLHVKCGIDPEVPRPPLDVVKQSEF